MELGHENNTHEAVYRIHASTGNPRQVKDAVYETFEQPAEKRTSAVSLKAAGFRRE